MRLIRAVMAVCCLLTPMTAAVGTADAASGASPVGSWQMLDGQARVRVTMCGDGTQLCALLTGLSGGARTPANIRLLNDYVVANAIQAARNSWHGVVRFGGQTAEGDIALVSQNTITVSGCRLGMCKTLQFERV